MRQLLLVLVVVGVVAAGVLVHDAAKLNKNAKPNKHAMVNSLFEVGQNPKTRAASCVICTLIVDGLQALIKQNKTDEELLHFVSELCIGLNVEQPHVCNTIVPMFGPEIIFVLQRVIFTPDEICGAFVADCGHSENPFDELWPMQIPSGKPPVKPWPTVKSGQPTMRVLHLSDIHIDRWYAVGEESDCDNGKGIDAFGTYALCCRKYPPTAAQREVKAAKTPAGKWGSAARCDLPFETFASAMRHINETEKLDYIIVTGDFEAHDMWDYTKERTIANIDNITAVLTEFFPTTPIYQAIGNHEGVPMDAMPPHTMEQYELHSPEWLYSELADKWSPYLTIQAVADVKYRASYAIYIKPGLKLISINTVYCSEFNFFIYLDQVDPDGTLQWLIEQLVDSEAKGDKVHIISHIPSGAGYCLKGWAFNFYEIVNRFENTIAAQFYGHTHNDHFQVYYDKANPAGRPTHFNFITPSLTTSDYNNPSYRIYTIDGAYSGSSYTVTEAETYWADLADANDNNHEPVWKLEYKTKELYGMSDLSPSSWHSLIDKLDDDILLFQKFHTFYYRNPTYDKLCPFEETCRQKFTCAMRTARAHDEKNFCGK